MTRSSRRVLALLLLLALAAALPLARLVLPDRLDPWAPLDLAEAPGPFTRWKLRRLSDDPLACRTLLDRAGIEAEPVPDRTGDGCGYEGAVRLGAAVARLEPPTVTACPVAAALYLWDREVVQPAARRHLGQPVTALRHVGSYNCRNVAGTSRRSQHATANAIDIAGFQLADGRTVGPATDWTADGNAARFLREVRDGACALFGAVLGPDYNAAHRDHFHLDLGVWSTCR